MRLKGGDPFVFGRGGEEVEALREAGLDAQVVPGVTSAFAVPAYAGIPVTHRGVSTSVTVVTGHVGDPTAPGGVDWGSLARAGGTIVILMGMGNRARRPRSRWVAARPTRPSRWSGGERRGATYRAHDAGRGLSVSTWVAGRDRRGAGCRTGPRIAPRSASPNRRGDPAPAFGRRPRWRPRRQWCRRRAPPSHRARRPRDGGAALRLAASEVAAYDWVAFTSANTVHRFIPLLRDGARSARLGSARSGRARRRPSLPTI